jgi:perosamine synthetase
VSWRLQPPVLSPVSAPSLVSGLAAAVGFLAPSDASVITTLCERYDASDALLTDSGTSALVLALLAVTPSGGTVAYPAYACIDLTAAAVRSGMRVRLYDLDPETLSPDIDSVRAVISRGVDAIVLAHLYGYPADIDPVRDLAELHGIPVIEDSAQGAGGSLRGTRLGALADISILSFGRGKGTTAGAGGAVLVRTASLAEWARETRGKLGAASRGGRQVVNLAAQWMLSHPLVYRLPASIPGLKLGEMVYHRAHDPRPISVAAASILPTALSMDDREVACRRAHAMSLLSSMNGSGRLQPVRSVAGGESGYLRLACIDPSGDVMPHVSLGALRGYPLTLEQHEPLRPNLLHGENAGRGSVLLRDRLFTVPTHSRVGRTDLVRLSHWLATPRSTPVSSLAFS